MLVALDRWSAPHLNSYEMKANTETDRESSRRRLQ